MYYMPKKGYSQTKIHKRNISKVLKGKYAGQNNPNWKGGVRQKHGYWFILCPNHPFAYKGGLVPRYRLVAEKCLGRYLLKKERIHHIDENPANDNPENLYLFKDRNEHTRYHKSKLKPTLHSNII